MLNTDKCFNC